MKKILTPIISVPCPRRFATGRYCRGNTIGKDCTDAQGRILMRPHRARIQAAMSAPVAEPERGE
jgi:hypothetical protein